jgi:hypothetical protein
MVYGVGCCRHNAQLYTVHTMHTVHNVLTHYALFQDVHYCTPPYTIHPTLCTLHPIPNDNCTNPPPRTLLYASSHNCRTCTVRCEMEMRSSRRLQVGGGHCLGRGGVWLGGCQVGTIPSVCCIPSVHCTVHCTVLTMHCTVLTILGVLVSRSRLQRTELLLMLGHPLMGLPLQVWGYASYYVHMYNHMTHCVYSHCSRYGRRRLGTSRRR